MGVCDDLRINMTSINGVSPRLSCNGHGGDNKYENLGSCSGKGEVYAY